MSEHKPENYASQARQAKRMAVLTLQSGCLTLIVAIIAVVVGLWIDSRLGTAPRWTVIALVASAPVAFGGVFLLIRRELRDLRGAEEENEQTDDGAKQSEV